MNRKLSKSKLKDFLIFAAPALFVFAAVVVLPFLYGIYLTFTNWDGISSIKNFIGLDNYYQVIQDKEFVNSMLLTFKYVFWSVLLINAFAFLLAYILTKGIKGQNFFRAGFFTPNLIGGIILGFIWQFVFSKVMVGIGSAGNIAIFSKSWLSDPDKAFWALVIVTVWQTSGYMMLIYVAGITGISADVLEAASIDGATSWKKIIHIVMPLIMPSFVICVFLSLSRCFMVYDLNLAFTGGEPYGSTRLVAMHVYEKAFSSKQYGVGQSEALVLFLIVALISGIQIYLGKKKEVEA